MTKRKNSLTPQTLRQRAEKFLKETPANIAALDAKDVRSLVHELQVHQIELEIQNEELRQAQIELAESRDRYVDLYELAPVGYLTLDEAGTIRAANLTAAALLGVERKKLLGAKLIKFIAHASQDTFYFHQQAVFCTSDKQVCELQMHKADKTPLAIRLESMACEQPSLALQASKDRGEKPDAPAKGLKPDAPAKGLKPDAPAKEPRQCRTVLIDVTARKRAEDELYRLNEELEQRVAERAAELAATHVSLHESQVRLESIISSAVDAIITIDERGIMETVNPAAEKLFGYTAGEMIGQNVKMLMPSPHREEHDDYLRRYLQTGAGRIISIGREVMARRKDGSTFAVDLGVSEFYEGKQRIFTGIVRDISERKTLQKQILEIASEEQRRFGQDLHDGVGQELTALSILADTLVITLSRKNLTSEARLAEKIKEQLREVLGHVKSLSRGLVPVEVDAEGLMAALQHLVSRIAAGAKLACRFHCPKPVLIKDNEVATHLFRIAQEAMTNALRHGYPKNIELHLTENQHHIKLAVADDGKGIKKQKEQKAGIGLQIMDYRARLIGGALRIEPAQGSGTIVTCILKKDKEHDGSQAKD